MMEWLFETSKQTRAREQRVAEISHAERAQQRATAVDGGVGLGHDQLELYDRVAHNLAARLDGLTLGAAERVLAAQWQPLRERHDGEDGSQAALDSLETEVIKPAMERVFVRTRQALEREGLAELARFAGWSGAMEGGAAGFRESFLFETSFRLCGVSDHAMARAVLDGYLMPRLIDVDAESDRDGS